MQVLAVVQGGAEDEVKADDSDKQQEHRFVWDSAARAADSWSASYIQKRFA